MVRTVLHYDKPLLRQAVRGFWWRVVGFRFLAALALVAAVFTLLIRSGDTSWLVGVLGRVLILSNGFLVALYIVHYRNAVYKLRAMGSSQATPEASEFFLSLASGAGTASLSWSAVAAVWQLTTCWLLVLSRPQFVTLPLGCMSAELGAFVLARVQAAGCKLADNPSKAGVCAAASRRRWVP